MPGSNDKVVSLAQFRADKAIRVFRARLSYPERGCIETIYAPCKDVLTLAEAQALVAVGWAEMRKLAGRETQYRVTLTPRGRVARDKEEPTGWRKRR